MPSFSVRRPLCNISGHSQSPSALWNFSCSRDHIHQGWLGFIVQYETFSHDLRRERFNRHNLLRTWFWFLSDALLLQSQKIFIAQLLAVWEKQILNIIFVDLLKSHLQGHVHNSLPCFADFSLRETSKLNHCLRPELMEMKMMEMKVRLGMYFQ